MCGCLVCGSVVCGCLVCGWVGIGKGACGESCSGSGRPAPPARAGGRVNAVKRSAVSTGQLSTLPCLHTRPIDPVVFREPVYR